jgi:uncharacterized protein (TIRG00374 family)
MTKGAQEPATGQSSATTSPFRPLVAGALVALSVAAALLLSLRYSSAALNPWLALSGVLIAQPFALLAIWFPGPRLARLAGPPASGSASFWANALSVLISLITPGRLSEAVKPVALNLQTGLPLARGFAAVALERLLDIGCLALLAALALAGAAAQYAAGLREATLVLAALLAVGMVAVGVVAMRPGLSRRVASILPFDTLRNVASEVLETIARTGDWRMLTMAAAYSLATWTASCLTFFVLVGLVGAVPLSPTQMLFVFVTGTLGFIVTVTPAGLGTYEAAIVLALGAFGYPVADALAIAILLRIANVLPAVVASVWFLTHSSFGIGDLWARLRRGRDV